MTGKRPLTDENLVLEESKINQIKKENNYENKCWFMD